MENNYIEKIKDLLNSADPELKRLVGILIEERSMLLESVNKDELTRVNNRRILNNSINYDIVAMCDVDNFKQVNDTFGHALGDKILVIVSQLLNTVTKDKDFVCRYGGDEFVLVLSKCSIDDTIRKLEEIKEKVDIVMNEYNLDVTLSFGISEYNEGKVLTDAIIEADKALYSSKQAGKNKITIYDGKCVQLEKK